MQYIFIYDESVDSSCFGLWEFISIAQIKRRSWRTRVLKLLLELWASHIGPWEYIYGHHKWELVHLSPPIAFSHVNVPFFFLIKVDDQWFCFAGRNFPMFDFSTCNSFNLSHLVCCQGQIFQSFQTSLGGLTASSTALRNFYCFRIISTLYWVCPTEDWDLPTSLISYGNSLMEKWILTNNILFHRKVLILPSKTSDRTPFLYQFNVNRGHIKGNGKAKKACCFFQ